MICHTDVAGGYRTKSIENDNNEEEEEEEDNEDEIEEILIDGSSGRSEDNYCFARSTNKLRESEILLFYTTRKDDCVRSQSRIFISRLTTIFCMIFYSSSVFIGELSNKLKLIHYSFIIIRSLRIAVDRSEKISFLTRDHRKLVQVCEGTLVPSIRRAIGGE